MLCQLSSKYAIQITKLLGFVGLDTAKVATDDAIG